MTLISDILLIAGALGVAFYCVVLSRRLTRFTDLEKGVGGAIAVLSAQVDDMTRTLKSAQAQANDSGGSLADLTARAEDVARRLELHVAALHDLDEADAPAATTPASHIAFRRPEHAPPPSHTAPVTLGSRPTKSFFASNRQDISEPVQ